MNTTCKNCQSDLTPESSFCSNCGAQIISVRITMGNLWQEMASRAFGWDNRYFLTLKALLLHPDVILKEYLGGTRKKYTNPFSFFAIAAAIGMLVLSQLATRYIVMNQK